MSHETSQEAAPIPKLGKYIIIFSAAYCAFVVLIAVVLTLFDLDGNSGTSIASLMGATYMAAAKFVNDHKRRLSRGESLKLAVLSVLASFLVSAALLLIYATLTNAWSELAVIAAELSFGLIAIIIAVVALLSFFILWFFYSFASKTQFTALQKPGKL